MSKYEKTLLEVLNKMPQKFTSNRFANTARFLGLPHKAVSNGNCAYFLHKNAIQGESRSRWIKKDDTNHVTPNTVVTTVGSGELNLDNAIKLIKRHGYKVLQPVVTEWKEL